MTLQLYQVNDQYIKYLNSIDDRVPYNHEKNTWPYVGVIFSIKNYNYFIPLSSPKTKYKTLKENRTLTKIDKGCLGVLNHNNMFPVARGEFQKLDITNLDKQYAMLLLKQQKEIRKLENKIKRKSKKLYDLVNIDSLDNSGLKKFCCQFKLLETACLKYEK
ncbi:type III toxin-antitoxin system ToxN/AbiQ family toxin [Mammaliicoccus vitulinus]|uniref:type III toxin-antitoxin system ToxN/AbiQ family toxin n=1 Tax=Mammaliicoccus vitulinus TaxID=71237 RepID=UPI001951DB3B|nr:type III toxin-antitoxin system ToxN/AbiQ family toxin [Mammaliicoccus vitulinus]MBM6629432.1 type III toxin-antitoxin system ToxN/AbiQ family toxin [Mammaliicoccus vitulinus]WQK87269.1 type III toxin-antitoxin system ToxN/AbiQ family toxin [Mammaliicoccus vitulinus]